MAGGMTIAPAMLDSEQMTYKPMVELLQASEVGSGVAGPIPVGIGGTAYLGPPDIESTQTQIQNPIQ